MIMFSVFHYHLNSAGSAVPDMPTVFVLFASKQVQFLPEPTSEQLCSLVFRGFFVVVFFVCFGSDSCARRSV